ncbi:hypothetical protein [Bosea lathyri]|uniref:Uncharacterized protein n=1 Tax=Bosea lathyri TaxID=1036778 RepID=A0A1H6D820_9HYPH|nr:hypothetical protein [Bosea lathyri]SEG81527.1 hypothetical protein SAMN04488115_11857 [Bosea lathyri]
MLQPFFRELRRHIAPRADILARGEARSARASDIILGMTLMMLLVVLLAKALTHFFTAA